MKSLTEAIYDDVLTENAENTTDRIGDSRIGRGSTESGSETLGELDEVRAQFEQWRCVPGRRHIPDNLWLAAIGLLDHYPISVVSEHLRLNSARLQQQQHKLLSLPSPPPRVRPAAENARVARLGPSFGTGGQTMASKRWKKSKKVDVAMNASSNK